MVRKSRLGKILAGLALGISLFLGYNLASNKLRIRHNQNQAEALQTNKESSQKQEKIATPKMAIQQMPKAHTIYGALKYHDFRALKYFLNNGHDSNYRDKTGNFPLVYALGYHCNLKYIKELIQHGADYNKLLYFYGPIKKISLLDYAMIRNAPSEVIDYLKSQGVKSMFSSIAEFISKEYGQDVKIRSQLFRKYGHVILENQANDLALTMAKYAPYEDFVLLSQMFKLNPNYSSHGIKILDIGIARCNSENGFKISKYIIDVLKASLYSTGNEHETILDELFSGYEINRNSVKLADYIMSLGVMPTGDCIYYGINHYSEGIQEQVVELYEKYKIKSMKDVITKSINNNDDEFTYLLLQKGYLPTIKSLVVAIKQDKIQFVRLILNLGIILNEASLRILKNQLIWWRQLGM